jgi:hypothetical protein
VDPSPGQVEVAIESSPEKTSLEKSRNVKSDVSIQSGRTTVKEVVAGLLATGLIAYFLLTDLPSVSLPVIGVILGYYFGSRNTLLKN